MSLKKISVPALSVGFVIASLAVSVGPSTAAPASSAQKANASIHPVHSAPIAHRVVSAFAPGGIYAGYTNNHDAWLDTPGW